MRALFWLIAIFLGAAVLAVLAYYDHGYALFVAHPYRVEISLNLLVFLTAVSYVAVYWLLRLGVSTVRMPRAAMAFPARKRRERADAAFRQALRELFEGHFGNALKEAKKGFGGGDDPALVALVAARAAHAMGDEKERTRWLARAAEFDGESPTARLLTQARLDIDAGKYDSALEQLAEIEKLGPRPIAAGRLALRAHEALGQWDEVLKTARILERNQGIAADRSRETKQRAHLGNVLVRGTNAAEVLAYWNGIPPGERRGDTKIAHAAAKALGQAGEADAARKILEKQLETDWDANLVALYAECPDREAQDRISRAEKWLKQYPQDAQLLLTLGRLCRNQQLWGKAQSYLEASLAVQATRAAHLELATLFDRLERKDEADRHYRAAAQI
ncbi:MAG: heme biosynthesis HemY N-terminal domain-containing protein [Rhodocyclaceae bacterium]